MGKDPKAGEVSEVAANQARLAFANMSPLAENAAARWPTSATSAF